MAETLLTTSSIKLYGRVVTSLMYSDDTTDSILGSNNFLQKQLSQQQEVIEIFGDTEIGSSMINNVSPAGGQQRLLSLIGPGVKITGGGFPSDSFVKSVYTVEISDTTPVPEPEPPAGQRRRGGQDQARVPHSTTTRGFRIVIIANRQAEIDGETGAHVPVHLHLAVNFARIYAFSFEGSIYNLPKPSIFFVFGPGKGVDVQGFGGGRTDTNTSGVVAREWEFAGATGGFGEAGNVDLRYWEYE